MKRLLLLVLIFQIVLLYSCSPQNEKVDGTDNKLQDSTLRIYFRFTYSEYTLNKAVRLFKTKFPDTKVEEVFFNDTEEYDKRLSTDIMAGEGPDVIVLYPLIDSLSVYKAIESNAFCDMNPLIEQDGEIDMSRYNKTVMDSGIFNGKRYVIPLDYRVPMFLITDNIIEEIGIEMENWTLEQLSQLNQKLRKEGGQKRFFDDPVSLCDFLQSSGLEFIDFKNKKTHFDSAEFAKILEFYKNTYYREPGRILVGDSYVNIKSGLAMADNGTVFGLDDVYKKQSLIKFHIGDNVRILPYPTYNGDHRLTANVCEMVAINNKCGDKKMAFELVKILLSEEIQQNENLTGAPVNNAALDALLEKLSGEGAEGKWGDLYLYSLSEQLVEDYRKITDSITKCTIPDMTVNLFIETAAEAYAEGRCTAQEAMREIEQKVMLYLNE